METERLEKIKRIIESIKTCPGYVYVMISHIDPDSLGSLEAMAYILQMSEVERIRLVFSGEASDEQNMAIMLKYDLLHRALPMEPVGKYFASFTENDRFILVDSSAPNDKRLGPAAGRFIPIITIDHHLNEHVEETDDNFVWIENIGSCATMLVELIQGLGWLDDPHFKNDDGFLPILLTLGIYADTKALVSCQNRDRQAFAAVAGMADEGDLQYLINYQLSPGFMEALGRAIANKECHGTSVVAYVGELAANEVVIIARVADFFIRVKSYSLVIVWAVVDGRAVNICARATGYGTPLDEFLRKRFGDRSGAKVSKWGLWEGGAQLEFNLGFWHNEQARPELIALVSKCISAQFFSE